MDMNTRSFHTSGMIGPSISIFPQSKADKIPVSLGDHMPTSSVGFTRYFNQAAVVEQDCSASHNAEFSQYLGHRHVSSARDPGLSLQPNKTIFKDKGHESYSNTGNVQPGPFMLSSAGSGNFLQHIPPDPYGTILENGEEQAASQAGQLSPGERSSQRLRLTQPDFQFNVLPSSAKPNLMRQSSLPADVLSRLGMEESCERPLSQQRGSQMHTIAHGNPDEAAGKFYLLPTKASPQAPPVRNCYIDSSNSNTKTGGESWYVDGELRNNNLIRHSSSPAGLLSQLSSEEYPGQGMGARKELGLMPGHRLSVWDEESIDSEIQNIAAFGQRKRGRDADAVFKSLQASDTLRMGQQLDHFTLVGGPGADGMGSDSTLCKVRAKRGCATHPRSIAERVRRTKISERMRKLQDLVPNLDKQAHTADMLDEVVEYVKLLQRQVQELSDNACECNGSCQNKEKNS